MFATIKKLLNNIFSTNFISTKKTTISTKLKNDCNNKNMGKVTNLQQQHPTCGFATKGIRGGHNFGTCMQHKKNRGEKFQPTPMKHRNIRRVVLQ